MTDRNFQKVGTKISRLPNFRNRRNRNPQVWDRNYSASSFIEKMVADAHYQPDPDSSPVCIPRQKRKRFIGTEVRLTRHPLLLPTHRLPGLSPIAVWLPARSPMEQRIPVFPMFAQKYLPDAAMRRAGIPSDGLAAGTKKWSGAVPQLSCSCRLHPDLYPNETQIGCPQLKNRSRAKRSDGLVISHIDDNKDPADGQHSPRQFSGLHGN